MKTNHILLLLAFSLSCTLLLLLLDQDSSSFSQTNTEDIESITDEDEHQFTPITEEVQAALKAQAKRTYAFAKRFETGPEKTVACVTNGYTPNWTCLGPTGDNANPSNGYGQGQIHALAVAPGYDGITNQIIYAGTPFGGLWKTTDDGLNWSVLNTDCLPIASVSDVAINPANGSTIFITTGDGDDSAVTWGPNRGNENPVTTVGVYRSTDAGQTWCAINGVNLENEVINEAGYIRKMRINPDDTEVGYIATSEGLFVNSSLSGAANWDLIFNGNVNSPTNGNVLDDEFKGLEFRPGSPSTIYVSGKDIYRSTDNGITWISMTAGFPGLDLANMPNSPSGFEVHRINITVTDANDDLIYAYIIGNEVNGSRKGYIYRFNGTQWDFLANAMGGLTKARIAIVASPENADLVYYGSTETYGSSNATTASPLFSQVSTYNGTMHADIHALLFATGDQSGTEVKVLAGHDGGFSLRTNASNTSTASGWVRRNEGLQIGKIWTFDEAERDPDTYLIGLQDDGSVFHSAQNVANYGNGWYNLNVQDGYGARIDDRNPNLQFYTGNNTGVRRLDIIPPTTFSTSSENGIKPQEAVSGGGTITSDFFISFPMENHPNNGNMFFGTSEIFKRKKDIPAPGDSWNQVWKQVSNIRHAATNGSIPRYYNSQSQEWKRQILEFEMAPSDPNTRYVSIMSSYPIGFGMVPRIFKTTTGNCHPSDFFTNNCYQDIPFLPAENDTIPADLVVTDIEVNPLNPDIIYVSFVGPSEYSKIWRYGGTHWIDLDPNNSLGNIGVNSVIYQEGSDDRLYIGTDAGVYVKDASMSKWEKYGDFPNVRVTEMKANYCLGKLRVATYGRALWEGEMIEDTEKVPYVVSNSKTWSTPRTVNTDVVIKNGGSLTITSTTNMGKGTKITVERGGQLVLTGATLTNECGNMWKGIDVEGDPNAFQSVSTHGSVLMAGGSVIEHAEIGIAAFRRDANGVMDTNYTGGIVWVTDNCQFRQNGYAVYFGPYQNTNGGSPTGNISYIQFSDFSTNSPLNNGSLAASFIGMQGVDGIKLTGNNYRNFDQNNIQPNFGILAMDSDYEVANGTYNSQFYQSRFENLWYGAVALGVTVNQPFTVKDALFENNLHGIYAYRQDEATLTGNTINISSSSIDNSGIYLDECSGYIVTGNALNGNSGGIGVTIRNSGTSPNEIRSNAFTSLYHGSVVMGTNSNQGRTNGLHLMCGTYEDNDYDMVLSDLGLLPQFMGQIYGAGNTFSHTCANGTNDIHVNLNSTGFTYVYNVPLNQDIPVCYSASVSVSGYGGVPQYDPCGSGQSSELVFQGEESELGAEVFQKSKGKGSRASFELPEEPAALAALALSGSLEINAYIELADEQEAPQDTPQDEDAVTKSNQPFAPEGVEQKLDLTIFPNPANDFVTISFVTDQQPNGELAIFNAAGQMVHHVEELSGTNTLTINTQQWISGTYFSVFTSTNGEKWQGKFQVVH